MFAIHFQCQKKAKSLKRMWIFTLKDIYCTGMGFFLTLFFIFTFFFFSSPLTKACNCSKCTVIFQTKKYIANDIDCKREKNRERMIMVGIVHWETFSFFFFLINWFSKNISLTSFLHSKVWQSFFAKYTKLYWRQRYSIC